MGGRVLILPHCASVRKRGFGPSVFYNPRMFGGCQAALLEKVHSGPRRVVASRRIFLNPFHCNTASCLRLSWESERETAGTVVPEVRNRLWKKPIAYLFIYLRPFWANRKRAQAIENKVVGGRGLKARTSCL